MAFPYGSNLAGPFDSAIIAIQETGILDRINRIYLSFVDESEDFDKVARASVSVSGIYCSSHTKTYIQEQSCSWDFLY